ncbi:hypothetical protein EON66_09655 [archaeon]|nr:MAG: hypothetical protein EON66_09655 [archaeon]
MYRTKFAELYRMAHAAVEREKDAVTKAREFRALVREEQIALEKARIRKEQLEAMSTQAEAERKKVRFPRRAASCISAPPSHPCLPVYTRHLAMFCVLYVLLQLADDVSRLEARDTAMQVETNELRGLESELTEDINGLKRENEAHVLPQLAAMMQDVADTKAEVSRATSALEALVAQKTELTTRLHDMSTQVVASSTAEAALKSEVSRVQNEPERAAKALESVKRAVEDTNEEVERLKTAVELRERENADQSTALKQVATMRSDLGAKLTRYRADLAAREDECSMVETSLRSERAQYKDLLERRIDLQADDMAALTSVRASETERDSVSAAYERAKRELKRKTDSANEAEAAVPGAEAQLSEKMMALARLTSEAKTLETSLVTLKKDMDVLIANFRKEDAVEKRHRVQLAELLESCRALELEKDQWRREEALAQKVCTCVC